MSITIFISFLSERYNDNDIETFPNSVRDVLLMGRLVVGKVNCTATAVKSWTLFRIICNDRKILEVTERQIGQVQRTIITSVERSGSGNKTALTPVG